MPNFKYSNGVYASFYFNFFLNKGLCSIILFERSGKTNWPANKGCRVDLSA